MTDKMLTAIFLTGMEQKAENDPESINDESLIDGNHVKKRTWSDMGRKGASNNIDVECLAKLYKESNIYNIRKNSIKKKKWLRLTIKYCNEKNLPRMDYKILLRKWSKLLNNAKRNVKVGETSSLTELILDAAAGAKSTEGTNADNSDNDWESDGVEMKEEDDSDPEMSNAIDILYKDIDLNDTKMPFSHKFDIGFLAKLMHYSEIHKAKNYIIKKRKWQEITAEYCSGKDIPLINYKIVYLKWKYFVKSMKRKGRLGDLSSSQLKNQMSEIDTSVAKAEAPSSDFEWDESDAGLDQDGLEFATRVANLRPTRPASYGIDMELLAKLYQESDMNKIKRNDIKKTKWQEIAVKYCNEKNIPLMSHIILMRKWSKSLTNAKKGKKFTHGLHAAPIKNSLHDVVLAAARANCDPPSDTECESDNDGGFDQGKSDFMSQVCIVLTYLRPICL